MKFDKTILNEAPRVKKQTPPAEPQEDTSITFGSPQEATTKLKELLEVLSKDLKYLLAFPMRPTWVDTQLTDLYTQLHAKHSIKEIGNVAQKFGKDLANFYGDGEADPNGIWKGVGGSGPNEVGLEGQKALLTRTEDIATHIGYNEYYNHIKHARDLLAKNFGFGNVKSGKSPDVIDNFRCLGKKDLTVFSDAATKVTSTLSTCSKYLESGISSADAWTQESRTKGPQVFSAAVKGVTAVINSYSGKMSVALGSSSAPLPAGNKNGPIIAGTIKDASLEANLTAIDDWINKETSHDTENKKEAEIKAKYDAKADWDGLYKQARKANDTNSFFDKYFAEEWGEEWGKTIRWIGKPFIEELQLLGFGTHNPFILFLKELIRSCENLPEDKKKTIKLNLSKIYRTIHNAVANKLISYSDIAGQGSLGYNHLVFCSDFYDQYLYSKTYIELLATLKRVHEGKAWRDEKLPVWGKDLYWLYTKIFFEDGKDIFTSLEQTDRTSVDPKVATLRSVEEIQDLLKDATGTGTDGASTLDFTKNSSNSVYMSKDPTEAELKTWLKSLSSQGKATLVDLLKAETK